MGQDEEPYHSDGGSASCSPAWLRWLSEPVHRSDVQGRFANSWYSEHVSKLADRGACGYPDMTFKPERVLTRGEFLKLVDRCVRRRRADGRQQLGERISMSFIELGIVLPNKIA